jgi:hypothetical protein
MFSVNGSGNDVTPEQFDMAQRLIRIEERGAARDASLATLTTRVEHMDMKLDGIVETLASAQGSLAVGQKLAKWIWAPVAMLLAAGWTWAQAHWTWKP